MLPEKDQDVDVPLEKVGGSRKSRSDTKKNDSKAGEKPKAGEVKKPAGKSSPAEKNSLPTGLRDPFSRGK